MAGENIFNMAMAAAEPAGIYSNLMQGVQDRNTLDAQRMQNLITQNQVNQLPLMNQFDATRLQQVQQQMEAQRIQDEAKQMENRQFKLIQGAQTIQALPKSQQLPKTIALANEIDESGELAKEAARLYTESPEEFTGMIGKLASMGQASQGMTEYQRQSLELEREKMRNKPAEDTRTSDEKNWARYEQLAKTNPEQARLFGTQIGIFDKDGGATSPEQDDLTPLLGNMSPDLAQKAQSAYRLAGGGKDGVKALNEIVEKGSELERRQLAPTILKARFKDATPEEMTQLQSAVDAAKDTESGFKAAAEVRETQRNRKKFIAYQDRAVGLIDRILQNDELEDVLGSFEGTGEAWVSDNEAAAIADIDELRNILTTDNLDLMKGVLSNTDIEILKSLSAGATNRKKGEKLFISDMTNLKERLRSANPSGNEIDDLVSKYAD